MAYKECFPLLQYLRRFVAMKIAANLFAFWSYEARGKDIRIRAYVVHSPEFPALGRQPSQQG